MGKLLNLHNKTFGSWTVLEKSKSRNGVAYWLCKCKCGTITEVSGRSLNNGASTRCLKCNQKDMGKKAVKHGFCVNRKKIPEYYIWRGIIDRCTRKKCNSYKNYGARGIKICDRWLKSFPNFIEDMGYKPFENASIERIDVNKNYDPSNCIWLHRSLQMNNKQNSVTINNIRSSLTEHARHYNVDRFYLSKMLKEGKSIEFILQTAKPYKEYYKKKQA